jgi:hypothetical protein
MMWSRHKTVLFSITSEIEKINDRRMLDEEMVGKLKTVTGLTA